MTFKLLIGQVFLMEYSNERTNNKLLSCRQMVNF